MQASGHGNDNRALLAALAILGERGRGVAVVPPELNPVELENLHAAGIRGLRFNLVTMRSRYGDDPAKLVGDRIDRVASKIPPATSALPAWVAKPPPERQAPQTKEETPMSRLDDELREAVAASDDDDTATTPEAGVPVSREVGPQQVAGAMADPDGSRNGRNLGLLFGLLAAGGTALWLVLGSSTEALQHDTTVEKVLEAGKGAEGKILKVEGLSPHYLCVLTRPGNLDVLTVQVEAHEDAPGNRREALAAELEREHAVRVLARSGVATGDVLAGDGAVEAGLGAAGLQVLRRRRAHADDAADGVVGVDDGLLGELSRGGVHRLDPADGDAGHAAEPVGSVPRQAVPAQPRLDVLAGRESAGRRCR